MAGSVIFSAFPACRTGAHPYSNIGAEAKGEFSFKQAGLQGQFDMGRQSFAFPWFTNAKKYDIMG